MAQTTKLNLKLYDEVDDDKLVEEARNPMFGTLTLYFFAVIFFVVLMNSFTTNEAYKLEMGIDILETDAKLLNASIAWMNESTKANVNNYIPKLNATRELISCQDYNGDGIQPTVIDVAKMFAGRLSKVTNILFVGHSNRDLAVIDNLSKQPDKSVMFEQNNIVDDTRQVIEITYQNFKRVIGRVCVLAQGPKV